MGLTRGNPSSLIGFVPDQFYPATVLISAAAAIALILLAASGVGKLADWKQDLGVRMPRSKLIDESKFRGLRCHICALRTGG